MSRPGKRGHRLGLDMERRERRHCGLCGKLELLSRTHVPPQSAGNTGQVTRGATEIRQGIRRQERQRVGGLWVRGLCRACNTLAGSDCDPAYADFAQRMLAYQRTSAVLGIPGRNVPALNVAPALVARSVLFGMFAINTNLREIAPELAIALLENHPSATLPAGIRLRVARISGRRARVTGAYWAQRVLTRPQRYWVFGEISFPPFAWALAVDEPGMIFDEDGWADASDWSTLPPTPSTVDLRSLVSTFPPVRHPLLGEHDEWIEMLSDQICPIVEATLPADFGY